MKNKYFEKKEKNKCNGCGVCALKCPVNAIEMKADNEGFYYPQIIEERCINCNKCKNICSNYNDSNIKDNAYVAINKNINEKKRSSSGGMFFILAKYIINKNGVVYGVEYGKNHKVQHNYYEKLEDCKKFQGSKYIRSDIEKIYISVENFLKQDRYVLFTGTPCQCNGLKEYLEKDYDKLLLCDVICHANPSQSVFDQYIYELEKKYNKKIKSINFRDKQNGWKSSMPTIVFKDGNKIKDKTFYNGFVNGLFVRPSCYDCKFSGLNRVTDFTIGDFWGNNIIVPEIKDDDTGISILLVNSTKAKLIFDEIKCEMEFKKVDINKAFTYNHHKPIKKHCKRKRFFKNLNKMTVEDNVNNCLKVNMVRKFLGMCKRKVRKFLNIIFNY